MNKVTRYLAIFFICCNVSNANINYINYMDISGIMENLEYINFISINQDYYNHWSPTWDYEIDKNEIIKTLKEAYSVFSKSNDNILETELLLGDISHYLYNLNEEKYFTVSEKHYKNAIAFNQNDFRAYWFLANHYALSAVPEKSIKNYKIAEGLLTDNDNVDFWEDYTSACYSAGMPSTCLFTMYQVRRILGYPGFYESNFGNIVQEAMISVNPDSNYFYKTIWTGETGPIMTFLSYPLGLKMLVSSNWQITFKDYDKKKSSVIIFPKEIPNKSGRQIKYSIMVLMYLNNDSTSVEEYIEKYLRKFKNNIPDSTFCFYKNQVAYHITDDTYYPDMGGAHFYITGFDRRVPEFPGKKIEIPIKHSSHSSNSMNYYRLTKRYKRFQSNITYIFLLDTCEDIFQQSFNIFQDFITNKVVIE